MAQETFPSKTAPKINPAQIQPDETIFSAPLSDIFIDYDWNSRSRKNVFAELSDAVQDTTLQAEHQTLGGGIKGLAVTLRNRGQDTPVILRRVENGKSLGGKKTDKPLELVCGFRRATAVEMVNSSEDHATHAKALGNKTLIPNTPNGTIRAVVRQLSPVEARILNGRENTDRQNLETQDMLRLVVELREFGLNQDQTGDELNITQGYVSKLLKIAQLPKIVIAHWSGTAKLPGFPPNVVAKTIRTTDLIELYDMSKKDKSSEAEIVQRYLAMVTPTAEDEATPADPNAPETDPSAERIKKAATLAAELVKAGVLAAGNLEWSRIIGPKREGYLLDTGKATATERAGYADLAATTYKAALVAVAKPAAADKPAAGKAKAAATANN